MNYQSPFIFRNINLAQQEDNYTGQSEFYNNPHLNNGNRYNPQSNFYQFPPPFPRMPPYPHFAPHFPYHGPHGHFHRQNNNYFPIPPLNQFPYINPGNRRYRSPFFHNRMRRHPIFPGFLFMNFHNNGKIIELLEEVEITEEIYSKIKIKICNICLEEYKIKDKISYLPCFHFFHYNCIKKWIENSKKCPLCNIEIKFE